MKLQLMGGPELSPLTQRLLCPLPFPASFQKHLSTSIQGCLLPWLLGDRCFLNMVCEELSQSAIRPGTGGYFQPHAANACFRNSAFSSYLNFTFSHTPLFHHPGSLMHLQEFLFIYHYYNVKDITKTPRFRLSFRLRTLIRKPAQVSLLFDMEGCPLQGYSLSVCPPCEAQNCCHHLAPSLSACLIFCFC